MAATTILNNPIKQRNNINAKIDYNQQNSRQLSRLLITGHIHEHTPMCVLTEIADAHGIKYEHEDYEKPNFSYHMLNKIHQTTVPTVNQIKDMPEWQCVARFVNKHSQWQQGKLIQAYDFLTGFMNSEDPMLKIPDPFIAGIQTPTNPTAVNACVLYKICVHHRLNINSRTTMTQMANAVNLLRQSSDVLIRKAKVFIERDAKRIDLINTLLLSPYEIRDPNPQISNNNVNPMAIPDTMANHETLGVLYVSLNNIQSLQQRIEPSTPEGAIALSAINYNIDISKSEDPLREYKNLKLSNRNEYRPADPWMGYWYQLNPQIFDLTANFNPIFPVSYYNQNNMLAMATNEGFTPNEIAISSPYELMQIAYITETFYAECRPNLKSCQTVISMDNISEIPYGELICYGQADSSLQPFSVTELTDLFNANHNFTNPLQQNSVFSVAAINKLKLIIQSPDGPLPNKRFSQSTINNRAALYEAINSVETMARVTDEPTRQFAFTYRNASPDTKRVINNALTNLLQIGMYMRGWLGPGNEYPVVRAPVPPEREPQVAVNVTAAISDYESSCRSLGKIGSQLNDLPLVCCKDGQYQVSTSHVDGITIGERISIVKQGDNTNNIASCIRLSSNWICASAHKYITSLGHPSPFDIFHLRPIS